jgi:hypothetical protein
MQTSTSFILVSAETKNTKLAVAVKELVARLEETNAEFDAGRDQLELITENLADLICFLRGILPEGSGADRLPVLLYTNLVDVLKGRQSPLIFARKLPRNRPGSTSFDMTRGQLAAALDSLVGAGMKPNKAAQWLADEVCRFRITDPGHRSIAPNKLRRWLADIRQHKATANVSDMFTIIKQQWPKSTSVDHTQRECRALLESLRSMFPAPVFNEISR